MCVHTRTNQIMQPIKRATFQRMPALASWGPPLPIIMRISLTAQAAKSPSNAILATQLHAKP
jgi:phage tail protein X